jgi:hypothetical protein
MAEKAKQPWDELAFIMAFESGERVCEHCLVDGFQHLVDNGHAWTLQGVYGRTAAALIKRGLVKDTHGVLASQEREALH